MKSSQVRYTSKMHIKEPEGFDISLVETSGQISTVRMCSNALTSVERYPCNNRQRS